MKPRSAAAIVLLAAVAWFATNRTQTSPDLPTLAGATAPGSGVVTEGADALTRLFQSLVGASVDVAGWVGAHPWALGVLLALLVVAAMVRAVRAHRPVTQDPQRMYSPEQRAESFRRAGGRCEYTGPLLTRCRRPAEHADHLYPHTRGGATTLENCVASCAHCNLSKGAKVLPAWRVRMLVRRRRRYYPVGVDRVCGERYAQRVSR